MGSQRTASAVECLRQFTYGWNAAICPIIPGVSAPIHGRIEMVYVSLFKSVRMRHQHAGKGRNFSSIFVMLAGSGVLAAWAGMFLTLLELRLQRSHRYPEFVRKQREHFWSHNHARLNCVLSQQAHLDGQVRSGMCGVQGPSFSRPSRMDDELQSLCEGGKVDKALAVLLRMDQQGTVPSVNAYRSLLKVCFKRKDLAYAKPVLASLAKNALECTMLIGEHLVRTLVSCGGFEEALDVFHRLQHRSVFSWTAVISGFTMSGRGREALRMYQAMQKEGVQPNTYTFVAILKACGSLADSEKGKCIHAEALKYGCASDLFVRTSLVDMYAKCGSIVDAQNVFEGLPERNVVLWNVMLMAYAQQGQAEKALKLYEQMVKEGVEPNERTFVITIQACGMLGEKEEDASEDSQSIKLDFLEKGRAIHADATRLAYDSNVFVGNTLVSMYRKCGSIVEAHSVFDGLSQRNVVTWNALLAAYTQEGQAEKALFLYEQMQGERVDPDDRTFVTVLQACGMLAEREEDIFVDGKLSKLKSLALGKAIHADAWAQGCVSDAFVGSTLISMYGKCGSITDAESVFNGLSMKDVVSWTAMLTAYTQQGLGDKAMELYQEMEEEGVGINDRTFVSVLQACGQLAEIEEHVLVGDRTIKLKSLQKGKVMHADALSKGCSSDVFVGNSLVSMYGNCGSTMDAQIVLDGLLYQRDVVSWNAMLAAYAEQGEGENALQLYENMQNEGVSPDDRTFLSILQACSTLADKEDDAIDGPFSKMKSLEMGKAIHAEAWRKGYKSHIFIGSTLVSMYGKCGSIGDAQTAFAELSHRNMVSWTAMLAACAQHGQGYMSLQLCRQMEEEGLSPDDITLASILQACSRSGDLGTCRQIHQSLTSTASSLSPFLGNTLIHAYGRCASMLDACSVFDSLLQPDVVSWTALIAGYARGGNFSASLKCYEDMLRSGVKPDGVTFLSLLSTCSNAGLVERGVEYFDSMSKEHGITPGIEHYVSVVDLLGGAGFFATAEELLSTMPMPPNLAMWLCLLGSCRKHGKLVLGRQAFDCAVSLQPRHPSAYVLMSNIYADAGLWDCAKEVYDMRQIVGAWKKPGQSWIEHEQQVHSFLVADSQHPQQEHLYDLVAMLNLDLKASCNEGPECFGSRREQWGFLLRFGKLFGSCCVLDSCQC